MKYNILIFGNGYVAQYLAKELIKNNWRVYITSRNVSSDYNKYYVLFSENELKNLKIIDFEDVSNNIKILEESDAILSTVPPNNVFLNSEQIDPVLYKYNDFLINQNIVKKKCWIGYLSSTGVYGDHDGNWVDENSALRPNNDKAKLRLNAEQKWLNLYKNNNYIVNILRLSGIYGPARNCLEQIRKGKDFTIVKEGQYFSRIHIVDIVNIITSLIDNPKAGEIYNLSDNMPEQLHIVQQYGAKLLNKAKLKEIHFDDATLSQSMHNFFNSNKKINSQKIQKYLNIELTYPSYHSGLSKGCI